MKCPGVRAHCPGCKEGGSGIVVAAIIGAVLFHRVIADAAGYALAVAIEVLKIAAIVAACLAGSVIVAVAAIGGHRACRWAQRRRAVPVYQVQVIGSGPAGSAQRQLGQRPAAREIAHEPKVITARQARWDWKRWPWQ